VAHEDKNSEKDIATYTMTLPLHSMARIAVAAIGNIQVRKCVSKMVWEGGIILFERKSQARV
jgi:hypothetical protein